MTAMQDASTKDLVEATAGIIFMGTPHRGARLATVSKSWFLDSSSDIRTVLALDSRALADLDAKFSSIPRVRNKEIKLVSFYETLPTQYGPSFLPWLKFYVCNFFSDLVLLF